MNEFRNVRVRVKNGMYFFSKKELPVAQVSCRSEDEKILYDTEKVATQCAESVLLFMEENEERKSPNIRKSSFYQELVRGIDDPVLYSLYDIDHMIWYAPYSMVHVVLT